MSLVIGIKCSDGIVVGADSAATFGGLLRNTIRQTARKIHVIDGVALIGSAGLAGLAQRYRGELAELFAERDYTSLPPYRLMTVLQQRLTDTTKETMDSYALAQRYSELGQLNGGLAGTLVVAKSANNLELFCFDEVCNPEYATEVLPFVSVGVGQILADPFLAHLKRVLWNDSQPTLALGVLGAIWTLKHAIRVNPGSISEPTEIYEIKLNDDGRINAQRIDKDSIRALEGRIEEIEETMRRAATSPVEGPAIPDGTSTV